MFVHILAIALAAVTPAQATSQPVREQARPVALIICPAWQKPSGHVPTEGAEALLLVHPGLPQK